MTFDAAIQTTYGQMLAEVRDKVGGMANWSIANDTGTTNEVYNAKFALETPTGEFIEIEETGGKVRLDYGPAYSSGSFDTSYQNPDNVRLSTAEYANLQTADSVRYWMEYVDGKGFVIYYTREEGDNNDGQVYFGFAELEKLWSYNSATAEEGDYVHIYGGYRDEYTTQAWNKPANGDEGDTIDAQGIVNPDGNFSNFPVSETNVCASTTYENASGREAFIGTHDLWMRDRSGNDTAHRDTVTVDGSDTYTILKEYADRIGIPFGMRMD